MTVACFCLRKRLMIRLDATDAPQKTVASPWSAYEEH
jgi:hypothetical protein